MTRVTLTQFTNGTVADASAVDTELAKLATALNGNIDTTNITAGSLDNTVFSAAYDPVARAKDTVQNFVLSGLTVATSASLSTTIIGGTYYISGKKVTISNLPITVVASKDTYIDLKDDGTAVQVAVANGATAGMTLTLNADGTNALRIDKLVSSGTAITSSTQVGQDPIGNNLYWRSPSLPAFGTATVATSESTASAYATDLATVGPTVNVLIGNSGIAEVTISGSMNQNTASAFAFMGIDISGASSVGASIPKSLTYQPLAGLTGQRLSGTFTYTGLTPGLTTFKMKYGQASGGTAIYADRCISVKAL